MSYPIRDFSAGGAAIGDYMVVIAALRSEFKKNPPKPGEKQLIDYIKEFGLTLYPQIMRATTSVRFVDAHLIG